VRARFTKLGKVRFTSHRDVARMWERALRRAELPVTYTEGFSPRPKLHFGLALSTSYESLAEYLDIDLDDDRLAGDDDVASFAPRLTGALPDGMEVTAVAAADRTADSLQQAVTSCSWRIGVEGPSAGGLSAGVDRVLAAATLPLTRERKGRTVTDDLRPHILALHTTSDSSDCATLVAELGTQPRAVRPSELLAALDGQLVERSVCRLQQWITHEGIRCEPLVAAADASRARTLVPGR
jgi:radical SAM-linked protein